MSGGLWRSNQPDDDPEPPKFDTSVAHIARVYDFLLGGKNNYAADREAGEELIRGYPDTASSVRANRAFHHRAVRYLAAEAGIRQFLDVGTGVPSSDNTHEIAQRVAPESRVVYVDNDPVVLAHARALLTSSPQGVTGYLSADARDPGKILAEAARVLDFSRPVAVMLVAVLHCVGDEDDPHALVGRLTEAVAPGSFLVISHPPSDMQAQAPGMADSVRKLSALLVQQMTVRSREQVTGFFDGFDLVEPGVVPVQQWRPDSDAEASARAGMLGGVGRKP